MVDGRVQQYVGTVDDVSERVMMEQAKWAAVQDKDRAEDARKTAEAPTTK